MVKSPTKLQPKHPPQPPASPLANSSFTSNRADDSVKGKKNTSILRASGFRRANSFIAHEPSTSRSQRQPFRKANSDGRSSHLVLNRGIAASPVEASPPPLDAQNAVDGEASPAAGPSGTASGSVSGPQIFEGRKFRLLGEARCANVRTAITQAGGILASGSEEDDDMDGGVDYIIVRLVRWVRSSRP